MVLRTSPFKRTSQLLFLMIFFGIIYLKNNLLHSKSQVRVLEVLQSMQKSQKKKRNLVVDLIAVTNSMNKYIAELLGTFALVFCGTGAIIIDQQSNGAVTHVGVAITFGFIVMAVIYALGDISGAHMNPAVTIAFTIA